MSTKKIRKIEWTAIENLAVESKFQSDGLTSIERLTKAGRNNSNLTRKETSVTLSEWELFVTEWFPFVFYSPQINYKFHPINKNNKGIWQPAFI